MPKYQIGTVNLGEPPAVKVHGGPLLETSLRVQARNEIARKKV